MQGIVHILDQAGVGLMQLQQETEALRQRTEQQAAEIEHLKARLGEYEGPSEPSAD